MHVASLIGALRPASAQIPPAVADQVRALLATHPLGGSMHLAVRDAKTGVELLSVGASDLVPPASTLKFATAAAALSVLGSEHRMRTQVLAHGAIQEGTLRGDLEIVGGADPTLSLAQLQDLSQQVNANGIREIDGAVVGNGSILEPLPYVSTWEPRLRRLARPLGGLTVKDAPQSPGADPYASDPAVVAAQLMTAELAGQGIQARRALQSNGMTKPGQVVATVESAPLSEIVGYMLSRSSSGTAETLNRYLGYVSKGHGTTTAGVSAVHDALVGLGVAPTDLPNAVDGSGVSLGNRVTAAGMSQLVNTALCDPAIGATLAGALAKPGEPGTLRLRLTGLEGRVRAKTGTLRDTIGLAGEIDSVGGAKYHFAAYVHTPNSLIDSTAARALIDDTVQLLAS